RPFFRDYAGRQGLPTKPERRCCLRYSDPRVRKPGHHPAVRGTCPESRFYESWLCHPDCWLEGAFKEPCPCYRRGVVPKYRVDGRRLPDCGILGPFDYWDRPGARPAHYKKFPVFLPGRYNLSRVAVLGLAEKPQNH